MRRLQWHPGPRGQTWGSLTAFLGPLATSLTSFQKAVQTGRVEKGCAQESRMATSDTVTSDSETSDTVPVDTRHSRRRRSTHHHQRSFWSRWETSLTVCLQAWPMGKAQAPGPAQASPRCRDASRLTSDPRLSGHPEAQAAWEGAGRYPEACLPRGRAFPGLPRSNSQPPLKTSLWAVKRASREMRGCSAKGTARGVKHSPLSRARPHRPSPGRSIFQTDVCPRKR